MVRRAPHWSYWVGAIALACYSVFRFREAMLTFYMLDDFWVMRDAVKVQLSSIWDIQQFFWFGHQGFRLYRPLTTTAYSYLLQSLFAFDSSGQHGFQLLVIALNILLVTGIVRRLTDSAAAGLAAGLLYLLAPGQAVNAYWLSAFTVSGTTVWVLLMLWCWLRLQGRARIVVCTLLQICGLLASEHAIAAPVLCAIASLLRRESIRPLLIAVAPSATLVAIYSIAKLLYLRTVPVVTGTYTVNFVPSAMLEQIGRYVGACFNLLAVQGVGAGTNVGIGVGVMVLLLLAVWAGWRGSDGARLLAAGIAMFVVSLTPVLVLRSHYYDHYICTAALGATLAVVGFCRMGSARHWPWLALGCACALLIVDVANGGKAWRENKIFLLVVRGSLNCASWVEEIQRVTTQQGGPFELYVPINAATNSLFAYGQAHEFLPGMPARVTRFNAERIFKPAPWQVIIRSAPTIRFGQPLPLWDARWEWLRRFARWSPG